VVEPTLDAAALDRLTEWGGAELREKMIELFSRNAPERVNGVRDGLSAGDLELAHRSAHSLKSTSGNVGAEALGALAGKIEALLDGGNSSEAGALIAELEQLMGETLTALAAARNPEGA
jgi:HPt (histidine-containing phosphotransfer) domain-containing protein